MRRLMLRDVNAGLSERESESLPDNQWSGASKVKFFKKEMPAVVEFHLVR